MFKSFLKMKYESNIINTSLLKPIEKYLFPITHDINDLKIELENKNKIIYDLTIENKDINFIHKIQLEDKNKIINDLTIKNNEVNKCTICIDNIISYCCIPCGHTYCSYCINESNYCYICRGNIRNKIKLYL